jgi:uncharacterized OsmC-like protein
MGDDSFSIDIKHVRDLAFEVDFGIDGVANFMMDEPEPLSRGSGPNPTRVLAASLGACLSASLLFCLQKARSEVKGIETRVKTEMTRNEQGRLRVGGMQVDITVDAEESQSKGIDRCTRIFKDFCVVTESVKNGVPVEVEVHQADKD